MAQQMPLSVFAETVLSGGAGAVELKPTAHNETWLVTSCATEVSPVPPATSVTNEPEFKVYVNSVFIDGTQDGSLNSTGMYEIVQTNQPVRGEWSNGDNGATAKMRLGGIKVLA